MPKKNKQIYSIIGVNLKRIRANYVTITSDCQKADPPTAASKYMRMMKICTSVTSMLSGRKSTDVTRQHGEVAASMPSPRGLLPQRVHPSRLKVEPVTGHLRRKIDPLETKSPCCVFIFSELLPFVHDTADLVLHRLLP